MQKQMQTWLVLDAETDADMVGLGCRQGQLNTIQVWTRFEKYTDADTDADMGGLGCRQGQLNPIQVWTRTSAQDSSRVNAWPDSGKERKRTEKRDEIQDQTGTNL